MLSAEDGIQSGVPLSLVNLAQGAVRTVAWVGEESDSLEPCVSRDDCVLPLHAAIAWVMTDLFVLASREGIGADLLQAQLAQLAQLAEEAITSAASPD